MNDDFKYLSDEELNSLIESTERSGLLEAPVSFEKEVLKRLEEKKTEIKRENPKEKVISLEERKREYSKFRFQVCMAMAASILFLVISPFLSESKTLGMIKETTRTLQTQQKQQTNYLSAALGSHFISNTISGTDFDIDMED